MLLLSDGRAWRYRQAGFLLLELAKAESESIKLADARAALPAGSSRAKVTSANARWSRVAEHRDALRAKVEEALETAGFRKAPCDDTSR